MWFLFTFLLAPKHTTQPSHNLCPLYIQLQTQVYYIYIYISYTDSNPYRLQQIFRMCLQSYFVGALNLLELISRGQFLSLRERERRRESMDFYTYPSSSSTFSSFSFDNLVGKAKEFFAFAVTSFIGNVISAIFTFFFALVGTLLGAMTGALIGQETESGFIRGAAVGAISGAVFSLEVFESSLLLWQSDESGIGCLLYLIDVIASLLSGRLVRERIGPAMLSAVQSQMGAVETAYDEAANIFDLGSTKGGLPGDSVERIPKIVISSDNNLDDSGERVGCSVCLQDFQLGETIRSLPQCHHMFHLPCIDTWLLSHGSCPLCRRDL